MRIRLLILTLLIIGVHQHIQAQYMLEIGRAHV